MPLTELWEKAAAFISSGELGLLAIPVTEKVQAEGKYYLIAENTKFEKTIYASMYIDDPNLTSIPFGFERKVNQKRFIMIPVKNDQVADASFNVWEDSQKNGIGVTSATHYILRKVAK